MKTTNAEKLVIQDQHSKVVQSHEAYDVSVLELPTDVSVVKAITKKATQDYHYITSHDKATAQTIKLLSGVALDVLGVIPVVDEYLPSNTLGQGVDIAAAYVENAHLSEAQVRWLATVGSGISTLKDSHKPATRQEYLIEAAKNAPDADTRSLVLTAAMECQKGINTENNVAIYNWVKQQMLSMGDLSVHQQQQVGVVINQVINESQSVDLEAIADLTVKNTVQAMLDSETFQEMAEDVKAYKVQIAKQQKAQQNKQTYAAWKQTAKAFSMLGMVCGSDALTTMGDISYHGVQMLEALEALDLESILSTGALNAVAGFAMAALSIYQLLQDKGPSAQQIIIEQCEAILKNQQKMMEMMQQGFSHLSAMSNTLIKQSYAVLDGIASLKTGQQHLQASLDELALSVDVVKQLALKHCELLEATAFGSTVLDVESIYEEDAEKYPTLISEVDFNQYRADLVFYATQFATLNCGNDVTFNAVTIEDAANVDAQLGKYSSWVSQVGLLKNYATTLMTTHGSQSELLQSPLMQGVYVDPAKWLHASGAYLKLRDAAVSAKLDFATKLSGDYDAIINHGERVADLVEALQGEADLYQYLFEDYLQSIADVETRYHALFTQAPSSQAESVALFHLDGFQAGMNASALAELDSVRDYQHPEVEALNKSERDFQSYYIEEGDRYLHGEAHRGPLTHFKHRHQHTINQVNQAMAQMPDMLKLALSCGKVTHQLDCEVLEDQSMTRKDLGLGGKLERGFTTGHVKLYFHIVNGAKVKLYVNLDELGSAEKQLEVGEFDCDLDSAKHGRELPDAKVIWKNLDILEETLEAYLKKLNHQWLDKIEDDPKLKEKYKKLEVKRKMLQQFLQLAGVPHEEILKATQVIEGEKLQKLQKDSSYIALRDSVTSILEGSLLSSQSWQQRLSFAKPMEKVRVSLEQLQQVLAGDGEYQLSTTFSDAIRYRTQVLATLKEMQHTLALGQGLVQLLDEDLTPALKSVQLVAYVAEHPTLQVVDWLNHFVKKAKALSDYHALVSLVYAYRASGMASASLDAVLVGALTSMHSDEASYKLLSGLRDLVQLDSDALDKAFVYQKVKALVMMKNVVALAELLDSLDNADTFIQQHLDLFECAIDHGDHQVMDVLLSHLSDAIKLLNNEPRYIYLACVKGDKAMVDTLLSWGASVYHEHELRDEARLCVFDYQGQSYQLESYVNKVIAGLKHDFWVSHDNSTLQKKYYPKPLGVNKTMSMRWGNPLATAWSESLRLAICLSDMVQLPLLMAMPQGQAVNLCELTDAVGEPFFNLLCRYAHTPQGALLLSSYLAHHDVSVVAGEAGFNTVHALANSGNVTALDWLLDKLGGETDVKALVQSQSEQGSTPVVCALHHQHEGMLKALLALGALEDVEQGQLVHLHGLTTSPAMQALLNQHQLIRQQHLLYQAVAQSDVAAVNMLFADYQYGDFHFQSYQGQPFLSCLMLKANEETFQCCFSHMSQVLSENFHDFLLVHGQNLLDLAHERGVPVNDSKAYHLVSLMKAADLTVSGPYEVHYQQEVARRAQRQAEQSTEAMGALNEDVTYTSEVVQDETRRLIGSAQRVGLLTSSLSRFFTEVNQLTLTAPRQPVALLESAESVEQQSQRGPQA